MPLYEYRCPKCSKEREIFHSMTLTPEFTCEECQEPMKRQIGGLIAGYAKGAGSYSVDYNGGNAPTSKRYSKK